MLDTEEWEMVPTEDDEKQLKSIELDQSLSIETNTSLECNLSTNTDASLPSLSKSDTLELQTGSVELEREVKTQESPKHTRYSSPLFQTLLQPIEPIKLIQSPISERSPSFIKDSPIESLIHTASLVSKTQKAQTPDIEKNNDEKELTQSNNTNNDDILDEKLDENFLNDFSVTDPEKVLMQNVVPGNILNYV